MYIKFYIKQSVHFFGPYVIATKIYYGNKQEGSLINPTESILYRLLSVKHQIVNTSGFMGQMVSVLTTKLSSCSRKAALDNT
jgi:hypothetical protein